MSNAQHPQDLHTLFLDGVNRRDVDALLDLYETGALTVGLDGTRHADLASLRGMLEAFVRQVERLEGETRKLVVHGDLALMSASFRTPGGGPAGASGEVARRQPDGSWRFLIDDPTFGTS